MATKPNQVKSRRGAAEMDQTERRIRAAMALAGLDFTGLAKAIGERKLSERTLRGIHGDNNRSALRAIAEACELPFEFFFVDFQRLRELDPPPASSEVAELRDELDALREAVAQLRADAAIPADAERPRTARVAKPKPDPVRRVRQQ